MGLSPTAVCTWCCLLGKFFFLVCTIEGELFSLFSLSLTWLLVIFCYKTITLFTIRHQTNNFFRFLCQLLQSKLVKWHPAGLSLSLISLSNKPAWRSDFVRYVRHSWLPVLKLRALTGRISVVPVRYIVTLLPQHYLNLNSCQKRKRRIRKKKKKRHRQALTLINQSYLKNETYWYDIQ